MSSYQQKQPFVPPPQLQEQQVKQPCQPPPQGPLVPTIPEPCHPNVPQPGNTKTPEPGCTVTPQPGYTKCPCTKQKKKQVKMNVDKYMGKRYTHTFLVGLQIGATTLKSRMEIPEKTRNKTTI
uniref:Uncharacterized protein n=1 Tax=Spermophilus dauricus TaxID=99837 RepID=A0A8C9P4H6_SPEDA